MELIEATILAIQGKLLKESLNVESEVYRNYVYAYDKNDQDNKICFIYKIYKKQLGQFKGENEWVIIHLVRNKTNEKYITKYTDIKKLSTYQFQSEGAMRTYIESLIY